MYYPDYEWQYLETVRKEYENEIKLLKDEITRLKKELLEKNK